MSDYVEGYVAPKNYALVAQKAIVLNEKNELLFLKRSEKSGNGGRWDFCGGGLDKNENPLDGVKREIKEESGLEVTDLKPIAITSYDHDDFFVMIGYQARSTASEVTLSWEHDEYLWISFEEAKKLELGVFFKTMLAALQIEK